MRRVIRGVGHLRRQFTAFELSSTPPVPCYLPDAPLAACREAGRQLAIVLRGVGADLSRSGRPDQVSSSTSGPAIRPTPPG
jgi:hypothetical protein